MKRLLTLALLLLASSCFGAVVYNQANVEANGWVLNVTLANEGTNGSFTMGFGANNSGPGNVALTLTSSGFDTNGLATTYTRTLYATKVLRQAFGLGGQAQNNFVQDVQASGANCIIRIALSDFVYSGDTSIAMTTVANWYSNNVPVTNAMVVANNSVMTYAMAKPDFKWSWPEYQRWTGTTALRCTGSHRHATNGAPAACVVFTVLDAHAHTVSVTNSTPTIDNSITDAVPVIEYVSNIDPTTFTDGDLLTCNFKVYPWIGNSAAVLDTSGTGYTFGTPYPHSQTNFLDKAGTAMWFAGVDIVNGNNGTGYITNNWAGGAGNPKPYLDMTAAATALLAASHEATVYLTNGVYSAIAGNGGIATVTKSAIIVTPMPGVTTANVIFSNTAAAFHRFGNNNIVKYKGITIKGANEIWFWNGGHIQFDQCVFNNTAAAIWDAQTLASGGTRIALTDCTLTQHTEGLTRNGTSGEVFYLIRGCTANGARCYPWEANCIIGNLYNSTGTGPLLSSDPTTQNYFPDWGIVMCNRFVNLVYTGSTFCSLGGGTQIVTNGLVLAQNLWENTTVSPGVLFGIHPDATTTGNSTNIMIFDNTAVGERSNIGYNDSGTAAANTVLWAVKNNFFADYNCKSDTFGTGNGARIGNWPCVWGVGYSGNFNSEQTNQLGGGSFMAEWFGLNSYEPSITVGTQPPACTPNATGYPAFISDLSWSGGSAMGGNGNYHFATNSPAINTNLNSAVLLPSDLESKARKVTDPPGVFVNTNVTAVASSGNFFWLLRK